MDWNINQRYDPCSQFNENRAHTHRCGAEFVRNLIKRATTEGLLA